MGGAAIALGFIVVTAWMLVDARRAAWEVAVRDATNLSALLERDIGRNIEIYDLFLLEVANTLKLSKGLPGELRDALLFHTRKGPASFGSIVVLDAKRREVTRASAEPEYDDGNSVRDYFQAHPAEALDGLFISGPFQNARGKWLIALSRPYTAGDQTGLVAGSIELSYFKQLFNSVKFGSGYEIGLFRGRTGLMRQPDNMGDIGRDLRDLSYIEHVVSARSGYYERRNAAIGSDTLFAFHRVSDTTPPLSVRVGIQKAVIFEDWNRKAAIIATAWLGLVGIAGSLGYAAVSESRRRRLAEHAAHTTQERLRQAQKMEAVGKLAGGIAHDFNNILMVMMGYAQMLADELGPNTPNRKYAQQIVAAGERARNLVQQILAFSRRSGVTRKPLLLAPVVAQTADLVRQRMPGSVSFTVTNKDENLVIDGDAGQISQILLNLALNALDALSGASGTVELEILRTFATPSDCEAFSNTVSDSRTGNNTSSASIGTMVAGHSYATLRLADSGAGIPQPVLQMIFEPFFTTKARGQGTGLGLSVVHGIVLEYDGCCLVTSRPGGGSVFTLHLPLSEKSAEVAPINRQDSGGKERILLVDDETPVLDVAEKGLARRGFRVTPESDPATALRLFTASPSEWDVLITDQIMPGIQGIELIREVKAIRPDIPCVLCTGFADGATEEDAHAAGVDLILSKPVTAGEIASAIMRVRSGGTARPARPELLKRHP